MAFDISGGSGDGGDGESSISVGGGGGDGAGGGSGRPWLIVVNAMIFLPISEGTFVDADDPLLLQY